MVGPFRVPRGVRVEKTFFVMRTTAERIAGKTRSGKGLVSGSAVDFLDSDGRGSGDELIINPFDTFPWELVCDACSTKIQALDDGGVSGVT